MHELRQQSLKWLSRGQIPTSDNPFKQSLKLDAASFSPIPWRKRGWRPKVTSQLHLILRLIMRGTLLPLYNIFKACLTQDNHVRYNRYMQLFQSVQGLDILGTGTAERRHNQSLRSNHIVRSTARRPAIKNTLYKSIKTDKNSSNLQASRSVDSTARRHTGVKTVKTLTSFTGGGGSSLLRMRL
jgi:hypothetical protein